jgi:hypothetical protein
VFSVSLEELKHSMNNMFVMCDMSASQRKPFTAPFINMVRGNLIFTALR